MFTGLVASIVAKLAAKLAVVSYKATVKLLRIAKQDKINEENLKKYEELKHDVEKRNQAHLDLINGIKSDKLP